VPYNIGLAGPVFHRPLGKIIVPAFAEEERKNPDSLGFSGKISTY
jgi:hypothetical protein